MSDADTFAKLMGPVSARILGEYIGEPNRSLSSTTEIRYGKNGSIAVDLTKGVYADHEDQSGGGVLDLLKAYKGFDKAGAVKWLADEGYLEKREQQARAEPKPEGKFAGFMDDHPVATYQYFDNNGKLAYEVLKFAKTAPRRYMQRRPHADGSWIWSVRAGKFGKARKGDWFKWKEGKKYETEDTFEEVVWWLYRREEVLAAVRDGLVIFLVEGEKDVETLRAWGYTATTNQGGAKNWHDNLNADFKGAHVIICSDNDSAGQSRTLMRGAELSKIAATVRVLDIAKHWSEAFEKSDVTDWKENTGATKSDFEALVLKAVKWQPERPQSRFGAMMWNELDNAGAEYDYLIDGWVTERGLSVLGGPSGSGKSFMSIHMMMCIARGMDFFQYPVKRCGVIYQAGEGGLGVKKRLKAYRDYYKVLPDEDVPIAALLSKVDLYSADSKDTDDLIAEIKSLSLVMSMRAGLFIVDTFATATGGADENSGKDMSVVLKNIARIEHECRLHVMLVHHMNADGKKLRGHTSVHAAADQVILVTVDDETKIRTVKLAKQKDDEDGVSLKFALASVVIGFNEKTQRDVTSCVVLSVTEKERLKKEQEKLGFSPKPTERKILMNMFDAIDRYGKLIASEKEGPKSAVGHVVVDYEYFRDVAIEKMLEVTDRTKAVEQIKKEFARNSTFLIKSGVIGVARPYMWWKGKPIRGFARTFPQRVNHQFAGQERDSSGTDAGQTISDGMMELFNSSDEIQL